jgi:SAM-dependent methyltransferase
MAGARSVNTPWPAWLTHGEWAAAVDAVWTGERAAVAAMDHGPAMAGHCGVCDGEATFRGNMGTESAREGLRCSICGSNGRQRAVAMVLMDALTDPHRSEVYITEHASSFFVWLRKRIGRLHGSEYGIGLRRRLQMSSWLWRSRVPELVMLQDVTCLTFRDASMDAIACQDVLEHVPDYRAALREFARILKPAGTLVLTVPFYDASPTSVQVACPDGAGGIEFLGEPEYHGDPVAGGVVCYHHFGWDLLEAMRSAGFNRAEACRVQDLERGLPQGLWVLRATR